MTPNEIIFLIVALTFILLVIFLIRFICVSCKTLNKVTETTDSLKKQLDSLGLEPRDLMRHTNEISLDLRNKLRHLEPFFKATENIGTSFEYKSSSYRQIPEENTLNEIIDWVVLGMSLWQRFKKRR